MKPVVAAIGGFALVWSSSLPLAAQPPVARPPVVEAPVAKAPVAEAPSVVPADAAARPPVNELPGPAVTAPKGQAVRDLPYAYAARPLPWKRWPLFDPFFDLHGVALSGGVTRMREHRALAAEDGVAVALRHEITTVRAHLAATLRRELLTARGFAHGGGVDLLAYDILGGLDLGHARFTAGVGLALFGMDYLHKDFSVALGSPRAVGSVGFRIGRVRIGSTLSSSFYARIAGRSPAFTTSIAFDIGLEGTPKPMRNQHPLISQ